MNYHQEVFILLTPNSNLQNTTYNIPISEKINLKLG